MNIVRKRRTIIMKSDYIYCNLELDRMCKALKITRKTGLCFSEKLVVQYMFCFDIITNKLCREEFGLGKTRSAQIFKNLVNLGIAQRYGAGAGTYYMLSPKATSEGVEVEDNSKDDEFVWQES